MVFNKDEKVFSLTRTAKTVPHGNTTQMFEELYCYLLVAALFREGEGEEGIRYALPNILDRQFEIPSGEYNSGLARYITKGLKERFEILNRFSDTSDVENDVMTSLDAIFSTDTGWYAPLTGQSLLDIALARGFSPDMQVIARYVAVMFGQRNYPQPVSVPQLTLSVFGNIHLSKDKTVVLEAPVLRYGSAYDNGAVVTGLWSLLSSQIGSLVRDPQPDYYLGETLSSLTFLAKGDEFSKTISVPRYANSVYISKLMNLDSCNPIAQSASFYKDFLYGSLERLKISRHGLLILILNLMMEKMGETHLDHLLPSDSYYYQLANNRVQDASTYKRPKLLEFALEALDSDHASALPFADPDQSANETAKPFDDPDIQAAKPFEDPGADEDPSTEEGGYDPGDAPPAMPTGAPSMDQDTIGLISFDKSGEGVNEDLYRSAVVALNDRLRRDDDVAVSSDIKAALDSWVNGWLYRTAIDATKGQVKIWGLQSYLKTVDLA